MTVNKKAKRQAKQLFRLCRVNGLLDEARLRQVVQRVAGAGYRDGPSVLAHLLRLVTLYRVQHTATVESAVPLPPEMRTTIRGDLTHRYGPGLTTTFATRPALLGGMRIQVGSDVYDGSVLARLTALEKSF